MKKMLIGIHDKNCSMRAVTWVMKQYQGVAEVEITLVHVFPSLPAMFWDEGHILTPTEERDRQKVMDTWVRKQRDYIEPILEGAVYDLVRHGFDKEKIHTKFLLHSADVADSLIDEAKEGGYQTIVMGRCGVEEGKHFLIGSIGSKIIQRATGLAVIIVQ